MFCALFNTLIDRLHHDDINIALMTDHSRMTFARLGTRVTALHAILSKDYGPGPVLVRGHKETDVVAAMIAATIAGRGFVFAESNFPLARVEQIIETCACSVALDATSEAIELSIPTILTATMANSPCALPEISEEERLFYITFTSGSTGKPKGIPISRSNFFSLIDWMQPQVLQSMLGRDAAINHASMAFDMAMSDIWPALLGGRASYLLDHARNTNPHANISFLTRDPKVPPGSLMSTPAFLSMLLESPRFCASYLPRLRAFWVGGEEVPRALLLRLRQAFPESVIYHCYGPSEVTCVTHCHLLRDIDLHGETALPLGLALGRTKVLVDPGDGKLRKSGEGEIVLVGPQVASYYLPYNHPNNVSFFFHDDQPAYRTGDLGALSEEGAMQIFGRIDRQVKINGLRIELGAIEQCALEVAGITTAVVVVHKGQTKSMTLIVGGRDLALGDVDQVRRHLAAQLPPYMQPIRIEIREDIPLTLSGKIDRGRIETFFPDHV